MLTLRLTCRARPPMALRRLPRLYRSLPILNDEHNHPAFHVAFGEGVSLLPDPYVLTQAQLRPLSESLRELVGSEHPVLTRVAEHFFELAGKRFRPTVALLASMAANGGAAAGEQQVRLAEISEMIHAASLLHDKVIDMADTRRGTRSAQRIYSNKVAVLAGDHGEPKAWYHCCAGPTIT